MALQTLSRLTSQRLTTLREHLKHWPSTTPLTPLILSRWGLGHDAQLIIEALKDTPDAAWVPIIDLLLNERQQAAQDPPVFVWTGPGPQHSHARKTSVLLDSMFAEATDSVLLAGFSFTNGDKIFKKLHERMVSHNVAATFYVNIDKPKGQVLGWPQIQSAVDTFRKTNWPFGDPLPDFYVDRRVTIDHGIVSLHAKCVVVDRRQTLLTSANFTYSGQHKNIEAGTLIKDAAFASTVIAQFKMATQAQHFIRVRLSSKAH